MPQNNISHDEIERELYLSTNRFNYMACWVGIILNIVWFISDHYVIPDYWIPFLLFRLKVSGVALICLLFREKLKIKVHVCVFILAVGIVIQNAYMWSVMDTENFQKHTLAYMALFIGIGMLVLWRDIYSWIILIAYILSNVFFYSINSLLSLDQVLTLGGLLISTVAIFSVFMVRNRYRLTISEIKSRLEVNYAKKIVEEKNNEITDSINYSKRIQQGLLNQGEMLQNNLKEHFILFQPKDIVSGDFYWSTNITKMQALPGKMIPTVNCNLFYFAICDSTGHGVPGAFMSLLNMSFLSEAINEKEISKPHEIFNHIREKLIKTVSLDGEGKDGMDGVLLCINQTTHQVTYSGANNAPVIIRDNAIIILPKDKMPVGKGEKTDSFTLYNIDLQPGDVLYVYTDGYPDQFGGNKEKKFMHKKLNELLIEINQKPMTEQKEILKTTLKKWKGDLDQIDDVLVVGIKF